MKSFNQYLTESRSAPLYHGTLPHTAELILRYNMIEARTGHQAKNLGLTTKHAEKRSFGGQWGDINGVSLSRLFRTASSFGSVVFELDQAKLIQNQKLVPIQYFNIDNGVVSARSTKKKRFGQSTEAEEFALGSIKNLDRYLNKIWIPDDWDDINTVGREDIADLLKHPKAQLYTSGGNRPR